MKRLFFMSFIFSMNMFGAAASGGAAGAAAADAVADAVTLKEHLGSTLESYLLIQSGDSGTQGYDVETKRWKKKDLPETISVFMVLLNPRLWHGGAGLMVMLQNALSTHFEVGEVFSKKQLELHADGTKTLGEFSHDGIATEGHTDWFGNGKSAVIICTNRLPTDNAKALLEQEQEMFITGLEISSAAFDKLSDSIMNEQMLGAIDSHSNATTS